MKDINLNEKLFKTKAIDHSPFYMVENNSKEFTRYFGAVGRYRITDEFDSPDSVLDSAKTFSWDKVQALIAANLEAAGINISELIKNNENE